MSGDAILRVGTAAARAGEWATGGLTLAHYPDAPITTAVNLVRGRHTGPTLWVQSTIHGTETGGAIGMLRLFQQIDRDRMHGAIVGIMAANPMAFRAYARNTPLDGENLNRLFPGDPEGPHSRQAAHVLMETALEVSDAMMDLHSGGDEAIVPFYALYWDDGSPASEEAARLARAAGTPDLWASRDGWLDGAMFVNYTRRGRPGLIVECGGGGPLPDAHIDSYAQAIGGVACAMGILPGEPPRQAAYRVVGECLLVFNRYGGYLVPAVEAGQVVAKGAVIARVMDAHGRIVEEIPSPNGPAFIAAIARPYLPVYSGTMIAECIQVVQER